MKQLQDIFQLPSGVAFAELSFWKRGTPNAIIALLRKAFFVGLCAALSKFE